MQAFDLIASLLVLSAGFSYANYRWLKLPTTIGVMALSLLCSLLVVGIGRLVPEVEAQARAFVGEFPFDQALLHGLLGFLLFAGALHVNIGDLAQWRIAIGLLATVGVLLSTIVVGTLMWWGANQLGIEMRLRYCLLFGALISPTDPIAVLSLLKGAGVAKALEIKITGESLLNDGIGVVIFLGILQFTTGSEELAAVELAQLFVQEVIGGAVFGFAIGLIAYWVLKTVDSYQVEILTTLALVAGGYALGEHLQLSAPIAMVIAGLFIGNRGRSFAMSQQTIERLDQFWELVDEFLNTILFVLIGLEVLVVPFTRSYLLAGLLAIAVVLLARFVSIGMPVAILRRWQTFEPNTLLVLTWGGLRGGISVAMALSLPGAVAGVQVSERPVIIAMTYLVVVFSILVQGLTLGPLVKWYSARRRQPSTR